MSDEKNGLVNELSKFNKNQLIEIIIEQSLPLNLTCSDRLKDLIRKLSEREVRGGCRRSFLQ